jgi:hypothetical protein
MQDNDTPEVQIQAPGGSFSSPSVTLTVGGNTVLIPITNRKLAELRAKFNLPEEG